jgi:hypothetical protein
VQPAIQEHGTMAGGEDETITIDPTGALRIVGKRVPEKDGAKVSAAEGQTEMAGRAGMHRVDRESARLIGRFGQEVSLERHEKSKKSDHWYTPPSPWESPNLADGPAKCESCSCPPSDQDM